MSPRRMKRSSPGSAAPRPLALRPSCSRPACPPASMSSSPLVPASLSPASPLRSRMQRITLPASTLRCSSDAAQGVHSMALSRLSMHEQCTEQARAAEAYRSGLEAVHKGCPYRTPMRPAASGSSASSPPSDSLDDVAGCSRSAQVPDIAERGCCSNLACTSSATHLRRHDPAAHPLYVQQVKQPLKEHTRPASQALALAGATRAGYVYLYINQALPTLWGPDLTETATCW